MRLPIEIAREWPRFPLEVFHYQRPSEPKLKWYVRLFRVRSQLLTHQSALFNFQSLLQVLLLLICTCTYIHSTVPTLLDNRRHGALSVFWKFARVGERMSPYVAIGCFVMAFNTLRL